MSQTLTLELDDEVYAKIERYARRRGTSAAHWLAAALERPDGLLRGFLDSEPAGDEAAAERARERFESHFGEIDLGHPTGAENDRIDADLAKAYADNHQSL